MLCVLLQDLTQRRSKGPLAAAFRTALLIRSYLIVIAVTPRASIALTRLSLRGPAFLLQATPRAILKATPLTARDLELRLRRSNVHSGAKPSPTIRAPRATNRQYHTLAGQGGQARGTFAR